MFRKMQGYKIDLNKELGFDHLKPVSVEERDENYRILESENSISLLNWVKSEGYSTEISKNGEIFWKNQSCNKTNNLTTKLAILFNHLQPIILILLQYIYGFELSITSILTIIVYSIMGIFYTFNAFNKVNCTLPFNGVMDWKWNKQDYGQIYYFIFLLSLTVSSFNFKNTRVQIMSALINLVSFFVATKTPILNYSVGRIWCYYASIFPLFLLIFI
jgi:hypothetical protein